MRSWRASIPGARALAPAQVEAPVVIAADLLAVGGLDQGLWGAMV